MEGRCNLAFARSRLAVYRVVCSSGRHYVVTTAKKDVLPPTHNQRGALKQSVGGERERITSYGGLATAGRPFR